MLEHCCGDLLPFSHISISEVGHCCWAIWPGSQSAFQFIPKVFDGVEVRALCRSVKLIHTDLDKPFLNGPRFEQWALWCWNRKGPSPNCCYKIWSTESSRMSLYAVVLIFPFIGTKGPSPNHEKQPQTIIPPPPTSVLGIRQTQISLLDCQMVKRDSSLQRKRFHCSRVQWWRALHHSSRRLALHMLILGLCAAARPWKPLNYQICSFWKWFIKSRRKHDSR